MSTEQTKKPYSFSFEDEWNDAPENGSEPPCTSETEDLPHYDPNELCVINGEDLSDMRLEPVRFCVEGLLPEGLSILGGAAKEGKSWLVLDLSIQVARGLPFWDIPTKRGDVLYLCLEDSLNRIQSRLNRVTDDPPENLFFSITAGTIAGGLCEQIRSFKQSHRNLTLVVVDTFQVVRGGSTEVSYAGDYTDVRQLKALAEELRIALLLVHHLRKQKDKDPLNMVSGTTGITGAADAVFILKRTKRESVNASLTCTGRDIEQRTLMLRFDQERCRWDCMSDNAGRPEKKLPKEMELFVSFLRERGAFNGSNTELAEQFNNYAGTSLSPKGLKQRMNQWRYDLEECGVFFDNRRSNGTRMVSAEYRQPKDSDASAVSDASSDGGNTCVPCVTCDPVPAP